jgi:hypothetical protein
LNCYDFGIFHVKCLKAKSANSAEMVNGKLPLMNYLEVGIVAVARKQLQELNYFENGG